MSIRPAVIGRLRGHGRPIEVGEPANLTLVDPAGSYLVDPASLASKSRNTPFAGRTLPAAVVATFLRGRPTAPLPVSDVSPRSETENFSSLINEKRHSVRGGAA
jgi:hypothetical protein